MLGMFAAAAAAGLGGALAGTGGRIVLRHLSRGVWLRPGWCEAVTAVLWVVVAWRLPQLPVWWWPVPGLLAWLTVMLCAIDLRCGRLPDPLTLPAYPVAAVLVAVGAVSSDDAAMPVRAVLGGALWAGGYALVRRFAPDAFGGGDVKLAGCLGGLTAATSWLGLLAAVLVTSLLAAGLGVVALARGRRTVVHGPPMLFGALLVVTVWEPGAPGVGG